MYLYLSSCASMRKLKRVPSFVTTAESRDLDAVPRRAPRGCKSFMSG